MCQCFLGFGQQAVQDCALWKKGHSQNESHDWLRCLPLKHFLIIAQVATIHSGHAFLKRQRLEFKIARTEYVSTGEEKTVHGGNLKSLYGGSSPVLAEGWGLHMYWVRLLKAYQRAEIWSYGIESRTEMLECEQCSGLWNSSPTIVRNLFNILLIFVKV